MPPKRSLKGVKAKWMAERLKKPSFKKKRASRVKGAILPREEFKFADVALASYAPVAGTGTVTLLNGIAEGDDYTSRDGRQATMKSIQVRGDVRAANVSFTGHVARMLIV